MDKYELLMTMTEIVGRVHRNSSKNKRKKECCERNKGEFKEKTGKSLKNMSPLAESTLCLLLREGAMNQSAIARHMYVSSQAISELMKRLETRELIIRVSGEYNNSNIIRLTKLGEDTARAYEKKSNEVAEKLFGNFTEEEIVIFNLLLNKAKGKNDSNS
ncbi:MAG: MarR family transcriptional regulator [Clostridia bacterium]